MRKLILFTAAVLLLAMPFTFNACGIQGLPGSSSSNSVIGQNGGTTGNPLVPLRAIAYSLQRNYMACFKTLMLVRTDDTKTMINVLERPTSISFTGTEFGAFEFPEGTYKQIGLTFVPKCVMNESSVLSSFVMTNNQGDFVSTDFIVMKFDGNFTYPDPQGRHPVLDITPIVLRLEEVTSNAEIAPAAAFENGTFSLGAP